MFCLWFVVCVYAIELHLPCGRVIITNGARQLMNQITALVFAQSTPFAAATKPPALSRDSVWNKAHARDRFAHLGAWLAARGIPKIEPATAPAQHYSLSVSWWLSRVWGFSSIYLPQPIAPPNRTDAIGCGLSKRNAAFYQVPYFEDFFWLNAATPPPSEARKFGATSDRSAMRLLLALLWPRSDCLAPLVPIT